MKRLLILVCIIVPALFLIPIPFRYERVLCGLCVEGRPCPKCPEEGSIGWKPPMIFSLYSWITQSNQSTTIPSEGSSTQEITKEKAIALVQKSFPEVKNIKETQSAIGQSMNIVAKQKDGFWKVLFWQGSGDCEAGCLNDHEWYFIVRSDSSVEKVGEFERIFNSRKNGYDEKGTRIADFLDKE